MLAEAVKAASATVVSAIQRASEATGADFHYLLGTAMRESGLKPQAQANTSSAAGLFQFVEQTWLGLVKEYGARYGLGSYANAISRGADGRYRAPDASDRSAILALRHDPQISALMAGEYARRTQGEMEAGLGRRLCGGELYAAHFLGPDAACRLIRLNETSPGASAAAQFPQAAGANRSVFYRADGTSKTVGEVYAWATAQPAGNLTLPGSAAPPAATVVTSSDNVAGLLASLWGTGRHGFFSTSEASPFRLSADVLSVLSSVAKDGGAS